MEIRNFFNRLTNKNILLATSALLFSLNVYADTCPLAKNLTPDGTSTTIYQDSQSKSKWELTPQPFNPKSLAEVQSMRFWKASLSAFLINNILSTPTLYCTYSFADHSDQNLPITLKYISNNSPGQIIIPLVPPTDGPGLKANNLESGWVFYPFSNLEPYRYVCGAADGGVVELVEQCPYAVATVK